MLTGFVVDDPEAALFVSKDAIDSSTDELVLQTAAERPLGSSFGDAAAESIALARSRVYFSRPGVRARTLSALPTPQHPSRNSSDLIIGAKRS